MPDKYFSTFVECGMVNMILRDIDNYARADTKVKLCQVLTYIATQKDCKAYILKYNGLEKAMRIMGDPNEEIKFAALMLIQHLT